jgi:hypothetical protein
VARDGGLDEAAVVPVAMISVTVVLIDEVDFFC